MNFKSYEQVIDSAYKIAEEQGEACGHGEKNLKSMVSVRDELVKSFCFECDQDYSKTDAILTAQLKQVIEDVQPYKMSNHDYSTSEEKPFADLR